MLGHLGHRQQLQPFDLHGALVDLVEFRILFLLVPNDRRELVVTAAAAAALRMEEGVLERVVDGAAVGWDRLQQLLDEIAGSGVGDRSELLLHLRVVPHGDIRHRVA